MSWIGVLLGLSDEVIQPPDIVTNDATITHSAIPLGILTIEGSIRVLHDLAESKRPALLLCLFFHVFVFS